MLYLVERPGWLVTKQELLDAVWSDIHITEGVLKRAVLEIRRALSDPVDEPRYIQTLHRRGYRFLSGTWEQSAAVAQIPAENGVVGCVREFQQLDAWFEEAVGSSRQIVFIFGEVGLGKTTLVDTWMGMLRKRGLTDRGGVALARGRCLQQFGSGEPYLPVFEALEQLSQTLGRRLVEALRARAPTWLLHMPALISLEDRIKLRDEVFGSTRERMLREITDALEALSGETPLVIVLEDLHWSDPSTIDLLSSIGRRTSPARLMILATYRPSDAGGNRAPLFGAQNELELHRQCKVLPLAYLLAIETGEYLTGRFPDLHSPALAAALHRRTNGNPLYVVCLADELERAGTIRDDPDTICGIVPETLQQMFERQAGQLSGEEQAMLDVAVTAGEFFSVAAVGGALGRDAAEIESQCEGLVGRHIILKRGEVVRFPDGTESSGYSFLHALCRDALYRRILLGRWSRLHGQLGRAEEQLYASDPKRIAGQLGGHFEVAGDVSRAIQYLHKAAQSAAARNSNQEALQYLDRAMGMTQRLRDADPAPIRMDLLEERARLRLIASDMAGAVSDLRALAEQAQQAGAVVCRIRALLESVASLAFVDHRQMLAPIEEAKSLQVGLNDPILSGIIDVYRAYLSVFQSGWSEERADLLRGALPNLNSMHDPLMRSRVMWMAAVVHYFGSEFSATCEYAEQSLQLSRKAGVYFDYFIATAYLNGAVLRWGDLGRALRIAKDASELAVRNGSRLPLRWLIARQVWVRLESYDFEGALPICEELANNPLTTSHQPTAAVYLWLGLARVGVADYEEAWETLEKLRGAIDQGGVTFECVCPSIQAQAECQIGRQDLAQARTLAQRLVQVASEHHEFSYVAGGHRLLAEIDNLQGDYTAAIQHISSALEVLQKCEAWIVEWRVHATASRVFCNVGRHREANEAWERGFELAQCIAATLVDELALQVCFLRRVARELDTRVASA